MQVFVTSEMSKQSAQQEEKQRRKSENGARSKTKSHVTESRTTSVTNLYVEILRGHSRIAVQ